MGVGLLVSGSILRPKIDFVGVSGDFGGSVLVILVIGVTGVSFGVSVNVDGFGGSLAESKPESDGLLDFGAANRE